MKSLREYVKESAHKDMTKEEAVQYLYDELNYANNKANKFYDRDKMDVDTVWHTIENIYIKDQNKEEIQLKLIQFLKENDLLKASK